MIDLILMNVATKISENHKEPQVSDLIPAQARERFEEMVKEQLERSTVPEKRVTEKKEAKEEKEELKTQNKDKNIKKDEKETPEKLREGLTPEAVDANSISPLK